MNVSLDYYKIFYYVAKYEKISIAAEKLYISQPAITQTIQKLEDILDINLFVRSTRGVKLTDDGVNLYNYIKDSIIILENASNRIDRYKNLELGTISIKTSSALAKTILVEPLSRFSKDYPNIKIIISTGSPSSSVKELSNGEIDLALLNLPFDGNMYDNIKLEECYRKEYVFAMSKEYMEQANVNLDEINNLEDIKNYQTIFPYYESGQRTFLNSQTDVFKDYDPSIQLTSDQSRVELLKNGCGIAFIEKRLIENEVENGSIIVIPFKQCFIGLTGIATLNNSLSSYATEKLTEYIKEYLEKIEGEEK